MYQRIFFYRIHDWIEFFFFAPPQFLSTLCTFAPPARRVAASFLNRFSNQNLSLFYLGLKCSEDKETRNGCDFRASLLLLRELVDPLHQAPDACRQFSVASMVKASQNDNSPFDSFMSQSVVL
jgi:hypothetical protein